MSKIIACDVDDVVADLIGEWLRRYNADYADWLEPKDITRWDFMQFVKSECGDRFYDYLTNPDLYDHIEPIPGALESIARLQAAGHRVVFVTSCVREGMYDQKYRWLQKHGLLGDRKDYVGVHDKALVAADALIDDGVHNVFPWSMRWERPAVLFDKPHNRYYSPPVSGIHRARGWGETMALLEEVL